MKHTLWLLKLALLIIFLTSCTNSPVKILQVSNNGRHLEYNDGTPFFYLGDTAWELFHRLNREEADLYLTDRAGKGFTVIQAVILAELDGLVTPNAYGDCPFVNNDPARPVEAYFQHVDYIVNRANELGLFIGMLPTWGDKFNKKWGVGPEIFSVENAKIYGEFLGKRYRNSQIIWILGGDRSPENDTHLAIIRTLAKGLEKGDNGLHLMTYHPMGGGNSATWFHNDPWLDFNMFQSGHSAPNLANYEITRYNYSLTPIKPVIDGEPRYEDHPINWNTANGWFDDFDVRQAAYWSVLSGAAGHTFGNHNIWQMWQPNRVPVSEARTPWQLAINHPGAYQMGVMRTFFTKYPWHQLIPEPGLLVSDNTHDSGYCAAALAKDSSFAVVYSPLGKSFVLDLQLISGDRLSVCWFNPRNGESTETQTIEKNNSHTFISPGSGRGEDWLLVIKNNTIRELSAGK